MLPAALLCGIVFAGTQFLVSNFIGPELTDILASLAAIGSLVVLLQVLAAAGQVPAARADGPSRAATDAIPSGEACSPGRPSSCW